MKTSAAKSGGAVLFLISALLAPVFLARCSGAQKPKPLALASEGLECGDPAVMDSEGDYPLHKAVKAKDLEKVSCLVGKGADPNAKNKKGAAALHLAVLSVDTHSPDSFSSSAEIVRYIVENTEASVDIELNFSGPPGKESFLTPLGYAVIQNHAEAAEILIQNGADIHKKSQGEYAHQSPYEFAALKKSGGDMPEDLERILKAMEGAGSAGPGFHPSLPEKPGS